MDASTAERVGAALQGWVDVRGEQAARSAESGRAQEGRRSSVTGGLHLSAINQLVVSEIEATGASNLDLRVNRAATLPGYYRATKSWDLVVAQNRKPVLAVEYKSMSGSEGKNLNNRADEIFGMAEDTRQAELNGLLPANMRRAYVFVMGDNAQSSRPVGVSVPLGKPDPIFRGAGEFRQWKHLPRRVRRISRRASSSYGSYGVGR